MKIRLAADLQTDSIVDGEGIRTVIWTQGCPHNCFGCHNPDTHDFNDGALIDIEKIKEKISKLRYQDGITFSGGDPMCQADACTELAKYAKSLDLNIWCYTGYTYEQLIVLSKTKKSIMDFLKNIDVLIDGKFILEEKSDSAIFRGSKNQRIIDVKKSLEENRVCLVEKYIEKENIPNRLLSKSFYTYK